MALMSHHVGWVRRCENDTLYVYTPEGDILKNHEQEISEELLALVGSAVNKLLKSGSVIMPEDLTRELQHMSDGSVDAETRNDCSRLITRLLKKMH
ncbi:hypothetical protein NB694_004497 [Pantoea ananatis]|nr:hypothetical protein [Pantoea ananatis]